MCALLSYGPIWTRSCCVQQLMWKISYAAQSPTNVFSWLDTARELACDFDFAPAGIMNVDYDAVLG
jgi:hypothetical protein